MSNFDPDKYLAEKSGGGGFDPDQYLAQKNNVDLDPTMAGSAGRHLLQDLSFGTSDEILGGLSGAGRAIGVEGLGQGKGIHFASPTLDWNILRDAYQKAADHERSKLKTDSDVNPVSSMVGGLAGTILNPVNELVPGAGLARMGANAGLGALQAVGSSDSSDPLELAKQASIGGGLAAGLGLGADKILSPLLGKASSKLGKVLGSKAETLAENATGATGRQAEKFADDAGRQLLDRGLVKFGDNPGNIAKRVGAASDVAGEGISSALNSLDEGGATASNQTVIDTLQAKVDQLKKNSSQASIVKKIQGIIEDIKATGLNEIPLTLGEETKRGYRTAAGNWLDPEAGQAGKQAYLAYMSEVEGAANKANPELAKQFENAKETYGLLAPIKEAAERRASTVQQSPLGGLGDLAAIGAGAAFGRKDNSPEGILQGAGTGLLAKKFLAPRLASSLATVLNSASKGLTASSPYLSQLSQNNPVLFQQLAGKLANQFSSSNEEQSRQPQSLSDPQTLLQRTQGSKYGQVLQNAYNKSPESLAAANFVLSQRDQDYRKVLDGSP